MIYLQYNSKINAILGTGYYEQVSEYLAEML